ncbi:MAG: rane protein [Bacilli bacterium]|nr:rane protein [Bacilli bacterium]
MKQLRRWKIEWIAAAVAAVILICILFGKPFIGIANNGDFVRITGAVGLDYYDPSLSVHDQFFGYAQSKFAYARWFRSGYESTQLLLAAAVSLVGRIISPHAFDIRILAFFYCLLYLGGLVMLIKYNKQRSVVTNFVLAASMVVVFTDIAYAAYFNSFFGEPFSLVAMLLTFGCAFALIQQEQPSKKLLYGFFFAALCLLSSKTQNIPVGVLLTVLMLSNLKLSASTAWRKLTVRLSVVLMALTVVLYLTPQFQHDNIYQSVFYGVLKDSPSPVQDLKSLSLSPDLAVNAGTNYYQNDTVIKQTSPMMEQEFFSRISYGKIVKFYLTHPKRLYDKLLVCGQNGFSIRPYYLGNYEQSAMQPYGALSYRFSWWSEFKRQVLPNNLGLVVLLFAAYFAALIYYYTKARTLRQKIYLETFGMVGLIGIVSFLVPLIGDGEADLGKHLFLFNVCFDMMFITSLVWLVDKGVNLVRKR